MKKFIKICFLGITLLLLMGMGYIWAFGIPNFSNLEEQANFCFDNGGRVIEPSKETYNIMTCVFIINNTYIQYVANKITNKEWAEYFGKEVGAYCFSCWDSSSCSSPHNEILREKGVHC